MEKRPPQRGLVKLLRVLPSLGQRAVVAEGHAVLVVARLRLVLFVLVGPHGGVVAHQGTFSGPLILELALVRSKSFPFEYPVLKRTTISPEGEI